MSNKEKLSRRDFLRLSALAGAGAALAGCGLKEISPTPTKVPQSTETPRPTKTPTEQPTKEPLATKEPTETPTLEAIPTQEPTPTPEKGPSLSYLQGESLDLGGSEVLSVAMVTTKEEIEQAFIAGSLSQPLTKEWGDVSRITVILNKDSQAVSRILKDSQGVPRAVVMEVIPPQVDDTSVSLDEREPLIWGVKEAPDQPDQLIVYNPAFILPANQEGEPFFSPQRAILAQLTIEDAQGGEPVKVITPLLEDTQGQWHASPQWPPCFTAFTIEKDNAPAKFSNLSSPEQKAVIPLLRAGLPQIGGPNPEDQGQITRYPLYRGTISLIYPQGEDDPNNIQMASFPFLKKPDCKRLTS